jgi:hypothetical protein
MAIRFHLSPLSVHGRLAKRAWRKSRRFAKDFGEMALAAVADARADLAD